MPGRFATALATAALLGALPARAIDPFEIQVYGPDIDAPGEPSLELHLNFTWDGQGAPAPGALPALHAGHYTLEAALGALDWLELGAYLQTLSAPGFGFRYAGFKLRAKMVVPRRVTGAFFLGLNVEVGRVPSLVEPSAWSLELRPILGWSDDWLYVAVNPIFDLALAAPDPLRLDLGPCAKAEVNTQVGFGVGLEYYAELGFLDAVGAPSQWQQVLFLALDLLSPHGGEESPWELNLGVGRGLTAATPQQWIAKVIAGRSF
ncbi:MAG TPA: hypothetical protein VMT17_10465 [Anaeromyxobacteraceae bacterium]|nr:hypothetical protein [Anaeromyxobacteraceae bacterium]